MLDFVKSIVLRLSGSLLVVSFSILVYGKSFSSEVAVFYGERDVLKKDSDCYEKLWLDHIEGIKINVDACATCSSKPSISYNCLHFKTNELWLQKKYKKAAEEIDDFLITYNSDETGSDVIASALIDKRELLSYLSGFSSDFLVKRANDLIFDNFRLDLNVEKDNISFRVDTAAKYSTLMKVEKSQFQSSLISYSGEVREARLGVFNTEYKFPLVAFVGLNENLLGLDYLINFSRIIFNSDENSIHTEIRRLYVDDANIFIDGEISVFGQVYASRNFCLDTGADKTILMPKFYKKIRRYLLNAPFKDMSAAESVGTMNSLGRIVKNVKISTNYKVVVEMDELPVLFRNDVSNICDVVLGLDVLQGKVDFIDFSNRTVSLIL